MKTIIPFKIVPISEFGFHLLIKIKINNKTANMVIDTGASITVFDKEAIGKFLITEKFKSLGNSSVGVGSDKLESHSTCIHKIKIGDLKISDYDAILLDLSHINEQYKEMGMPIIDGVLGGDILTNYKARIDYGKREIKLQFPKPKK